MLEVTPLNKDRLYDRAIATDCMEILLSVLARDVDDFDEKYDDDIKKKVAAIDVKRFLKTIQIKQGGDRVYY